MRISDARNTADAFETGTSDDPVPEESAGAAGPVPRSAGHRLDQVPGRLPRVRQACPTDAIAVDDRGLRLDLGAAYSARNASKPAPRGRSAIARITVSPRAAREDLVYDGRTLKLAEPLDEKARRLFGRSLKLRQVSAGGSGACEADLNVLSTVVFDLGRFGIQFVASPRHADGMVVTGPVSENMRTALLETYAAIPSPKLVIVVGAEAISGGVFRDNAEVHNGASSLVPVDLFIPGWPPHPLTILDGLLRLLGRLPDAVK